MPDPIPELENSSDAASLLVADYTATFIVNSNSALETARYCLLDALARGFEKLRDDPECASLIGPVVPGALMPGGARVPGTSLELDPPQAAFCLGVMLCRTAGGDLWLDLRSGHAADSLGAIVATADYRARKDMMEGASPPKVRDVLAAIVKALEIQSVLAADGSGGQRARAAAIRLARLAATAIATTQLGGTREQIVSALSYGLIDGGMLIDAGEPRDIGRRDRAVAYAISRGVKHACQAIATGHGHPLTAPGLEAPGGLADALLGARLSAFGTGAIDRLTGRRSAQEITQLKMRFESAVDRHFPARQALRIKTLFAAPERLDDLPVNELLAALVTNGGK